MRFNINNQTEKELYWSIIGRQCEGGNFCHMLANGSLKEISTSDNTNNGYANYFFRASEAPPPSFSEDVVSGRLYLSLGDWLPIKVIGEKDYAPPAPTNPSVPGFNTIYDKFEFTFKNSDNPKLHANTTSVDFLGIPITAQVQGQNTSVGYTKNRNDLLALFTNSNDANLNKLVIHNLATNEVMRVLSPAQLDPSVAGAMKDYIPQSVFNFYKSFYKQTINDAWEYYRQNGGQVCHILGYKGQTKGDAFVFQNGQNTYTINKPTSHEILAGNGILNSGTPDEKNIEKFIVAAVNRGVFTEYNNSNDWCSNKDKYYRNAPIFEYAKLLHQNSINNLCYAFSYDDVCEDSSSITSNDANAVVELTLPSFISDLEHDN